MPKFKKKNIKTESITPILATLESMEQLYDETVLAEEPSDSECSSVKTREKDILNKVEVVASEENVKDKKRPSKDIVGHSDAPYIKDDVGSLSQPSLDDFGSDPIFMYSSLSPCQMKVLDYMYMHFVNTDQDSFSVPFGRKDLMPLADQGVSQTSFNKLISKIKNKGVINIISKGKGRLAKYRFEVDKKIYKEIKKKHR